MKILYWILGFSLTVTACSSPKVESLRHSIIRQDSISEHKEINTNNFDKPADEGLKADNANDPVFNFSPYYGKQGHWKIADYGFSRNVNGIEIFNEGYLPNRPYDMIGYLAARSQKLGLDDLEKYVVEKAIENKANALVYFTVESDYELIVEHGITTYRAYLLKVLQP